MNSFILIGKVEKRNTYLEQFAKQHALAKFDMHIFEPSETSFGIQDVRQLQKTAFMKPLQSKEKILVLNKAELLTIEAQNALLKLLEEPPSNTFIFLAATTDAPFLATITSRCKLIVLGDDTIELSQEQKETITNELHIVEQGSVAQKLALAESLAQEKEKLSDWFDSSITILRENMLAEPMDAKYVTLLAEIQKARRLFQTTNVTPRMILEHCFLTV